MAGQRTDADEGEGRAMGAAQVPLERFLRWSDDDGNGEERLDEHAAGLGRRVAAVSAPPHRRQAR